MLVIALPPFTSPLAMAFLLVVWVGLLGGDKPVSIQGDLMELMYVRQPETARNDAVDRGSAPDHIDSGRRGR